MSNNNEHSGAILVFALVATAVAVMAAFAFAVLVFLSFLLTCFCLAAWNKPLTLFGHTLTPQEAREFVFRGIAGAFFLPCFALFTSGLFGYPIRPDFWLYLPLGGYALGSLVIGYEIEKAKAEAAEKAVAAQTLLPPEPSAGPVQTIDIVPCVPSSAEAQPQQFRFATWDDEEELRR